MKSKTDSKIKSRTQVLTQIADDVEKLIKTDPNVFHFAKDILENSIIVVLDKSDEGDVPSEAVERFLHLCNHKENEEKSIASNEKCRTISEKTNRKNGNPPQTIPSFINNNSLKTTFKIPKKTSRLDDFETESASIDNNKTPKIHKNDTDLHFDEEVEDNEYCFENPTESQDRMSQHSENTETKETDVEDKLESHNEESENEKYENDEVDEHSKDEQIDIDNESTFSDSSKNDDSSSRKDIHFYAQIEQENEILDYELDEDEDDDGNFKRKKMPEKSEPVKEVPKRPSLSIEKQSRSSIPESLDLRPSRDLPKTLSKFPDTLDAMKKERISYHESKERKPPVKIPDKSNISRSQEHKTKEPDEDVESLDSEIRSIMKDDPIEAYRFFCNRINIQKGINLNCSRLRNLIQDIAMDCIRKGKKFSRYLDLRKKLEECKSTSSTFWNLIIKEANYQLLCTKDEMIRKFLKESYDYLSKSDVNITVKSHQILHSVVYPRGLECKCGSNNHNSGSSQRSAANITITSVKPETSRNLSTQLPISCLSASTSNISTPPPLNTIPINPALFNPLVPANLIQSPYYNQNFQIANQQLAFMSSNQSTNEIQEFKHLFVSSNYKKLRELLLKAVRNPVTDDKFIESFKEALVYDNEGLSFRLGNILDNPDNSFRNALNGNETFTKIITHALMCICRDKNNINQGTKIIEHLNRKEIVLFLQKPKELCKTLIDLCKPDKYIEATKQIYEMCYLSFKESRCGNAKMTISPLEKKPLIQAFISVMNSILDAYLPRDFQSVYQLILSSLILYEKTSNIFDDLRRCVDRFLHFIINDNKIAVIQSFWKFVNDEFGELTPDLFSEEIIRGMVTILPNVQYREGTEIFTFGVNQKIYDVNYFKNPRSSKFENWYIVELELSLTSSEMVQLLYYVIRKLLNSNYFRPTDNMFEGNPASFDFTFKLMEKDRRIGDIVELNVSTQRSDVLRRAATAFMNWHILPFLKEKNLKINIQFHQSSEINLKYLELPECEKPMYRKPSDFVRATSNDGRTIEIPDKNADLDDPRRSCWVDESAYPSVPIAKLETRTESITKQEDDNKFSSEPSNVIENQKISTKPITPKKIIKIVKNNENKSKTVSHQSATDASSQNGSDDREIDNEQNVDITYMRIKSSKILPIKIMRNLNSQSGRIVTTLNTTGKKRKITKLRGSPARKEPKLEPQDED